MMMRSIPLAMTWELLILRRWLIPMGIVWCNFLPVMVMAALRSDGIVDPSDPTQISLQIALTLMGSLTFGAILLSTHEHWPRCYTLPARSSTLVACRMIPAMIATSLQSLFGTWLLNRMFGLDWPLLAPALFAGVFLAAIQAALLIGGESALVPFCLVVAAAIPGVWFKSRYGEIFSPPTQIWRDVTLMDAATMLLFAVIAYGVAVKGVARNRQGEAPEKSGLLAMVNSWMKQPVLYVGVWSGRFESPQRAHAWSRQTECGWVGPVLITIILLVWLAMWTIIGRGYDRLIEGLIVCGGMVSLAGMVSGLTLGNCGLSDKRPEMSQFLGTRPITDPELSSIIFKLALRSTLVSWGIWLITFAIVIGVLKLTGSRTDSLMSNGLQWWHLPATLLSCWIVCGSMLSLSLTGRPALAGPILTGVVMLAILPPSLTKFASEATRDWLTSCLLLVLGIACAMGTIGLMIAALRRSLITSRMVVLAVCIWSVTSFVVAFECLRQPVRRIPAIVFFTGLASLIVAPVSAAPLAVAWNRHR